MGNRNASGRRKTRASAYTYSHNNPDDYSSQKNGGSINRRAYQSSINSFQAHPPNPQSGGSHPHQTNGYGVNQSGQTNVSSTKANANKLIYIANYDFNGTAATGELSFQKGDRLEILDRYS